MSHVAEIHSSVIVKTSAMKESAERYLQVEVNGYKDIKELLAETSERLYNTQEVIAGLVQQHQNKIKQQQELDSLIDHLSNFQLISIVFLRENPKDHFNPITLKLEVPPTNLASAELLFLSQSSTSITAARSSTLRGMNIQRR